MVYTDVDGRYVLEVPPGTHQVKVLLDGYQEKLINVEAGTERTVTLDVGLTMTGFAETVTVTAQAINVETSSAEAQLIERRNAPVITDNLGAQEMKKQRRQRRRGRDAARDRAVARRQPVRLRPRARRAVQQHHARRLGPADDGT